jgi:hypothetical protein
MNIVGIIQQERNKKYVAINNCPRCHGALFFTTDYFILRGKIIKCFQCGFIFEECKDRNNGKNRKNKNNVAVMYIRPIYPVRRGFGNSKKEDNKKEKSPILGFF